MIVITTDSSSYLTRQEAKDLKIVHIPMTYTIEDDTFTESFIKDIADQQDYPQNIDAPTDQMHTSQPILGTFLRRFRRLVDAGSEVLCLTISSRLSGTYSNAVECAKEFGDKIKVVDTQTTAAGIYLMAKKARELIDTGLSLTDVVNELLIYRQTINMRFSVTDLAPLRRSGRLGLVRQSIGTVLNQRPILTLKNGAVVSCDQARGKNEQLRKLIDPIPENAQNITVQYFNNVAAAETMVKHIKEKYPNAPVAMRRIGMVLSIHLGFDVIGAIWTEDIL